jgi:hypothetical protein
MGRVMMEPLAQEGLGGPEKLQNMDGVTSARFDIGHFVLLGRCGVRRYSIGHDGRHVRDDYCPVTCIVSRYQVDPLSLYDK